MIVSADYVLDTVSKYEPDEYYLSKLTCSDSTKISLWHNLLCNFIDFSWYCLIPKFTQKAKAEWLKNIANKPIFQCLSQKISTRLLKCFCEDRTIEMFLRFHCLDLNTRHNHSTSLRFCFQGCLQNHFNFRAADKDHLDFLFWFHHYAFNNLSDERIVIFHRVIVAYPQDPDALVRFGIGYYLDYYNNRGIRHKLNGLIPAQHRSQAILAAQYSICTRFSKSSVRLLGAASVPVGE